LPTLPDGTIHVEQVWKRFRADRTRPLFYDQMQRMKRSIANRRRKIPNEYRWVLKDINFDVEPGGSLALIGINGSGKTTLLKILSHVTYQTAGDCQVAGRIGALLSVTAGLHPDLTGRENTFLYGAILGMGRERVRARFDEIVEFADLQEAIDRQVKFFSAGMQMRLGFSIAAHLEPDVLLVDEVLAVGDANFQQKCLQRIGEIVRSGTTLLYVSHDLASVEASCERAIWLSDAVMRAIGPTNEVVSMYRTAVEKNAGLVSSKAGEVKILDAEIRSTDGAQQLHSEGEVEVILTLESNKSVTAAHFHLGVSQGTAFPMFVVDHHGSIPKGQFQLRVTLGYLPLPKGRYSVWAAVTAEPRGSRGPYFGWQPVLSFDAFGPWRKEPPEGVMVLSPVYVGSEWKVE
jgi:ABC-type polysaccharide/polyol phosphate transport system ATPase subunit